jgi:acetyltransferase-like isoleucine patch superfamily enzyme
MNGSSAYPQGGHTMPAQASPGAIGMAQQALYAVNRPPPSAYVMSDKEPPAPGPELLKMFAGEHYAHLSRDLQIFKETTATLLKTFNDNSASSSDERGRLLEQVLKPDPNRRRFSAIPMQVQSRVGRDTFVETPFKCEYGSNIRLGENVYVEGGCHIADPREIFIDNGTQIGAGVKIIGKVIPLDPSVRCGGLTSPQAEGKARGVEIYIGKNVYIGANTVIQPEEDVGGRIEIGDYAYIKPGSIVSRVCWFSCPFLLA